MKEWNSVLPEQKYLEWRTLREKIKNLSLEEKLDNISRFFFSVPIGKRCIDFYNPREWPNPWEILHNSMYCTNTVALMIYYTIKMAEVECKVDLIIIDDPTDRYLAVMIDNDLILNYELGKVNKYNDIKDSIKVVDIISKQDIASLD